MFLFRTRCQLLDCNWEAFHLITSCYCLYALVRWCDCLFSLFLFRPFRKKKKKCLRFQNSKKIFRLRFLSSWLLYSFSRLCICWLKIQLKKNPIKESLYVLNKSHDVFQSVSCPFYVFSRTQIFVKDLFI